MPQATLIFHRERFYDDGNILELKLWQVPDAVRGSVHQFKYSLFYGHHGTRLIGYDNEAGKGDHRHYAGREEPYGFTTPEQLIVDFLADVQVLRSRAESGETPL